MGAAGVAESRVARRAADVTALPAAGDVVSRFGADVYVRLAEGGGNIACSPYSVAVALAMARAGARAQTADEIDRVLRGPSPAEMHSGFNSLTQHLDSRAGDRERADGSTATVSLATANSLWGQRGTAWEQAFLDTLAADYGAGLRLVDYVIDADGARGAINTWTSDRTGGRIPQIVPSGALDNMSRLVLVNAIYLKAPWEEPFEKARTREAAFTRTDGSMVTVQMMSKLLKSARYATGPGYQAVQLQYAGGQLAMLIVVPDRDRFAAVERAFDAAALAQLLAQLRTTPVAFELPRWRFRTQAGLDEILSSLGMPTAFTDQADFSGMTAQDRLRISAVLHEAFIAVDEEGTEAAAATAIAFELTSAIADPVRLSVDRPFLFVLHDVETAIPLFIGRVDNPSEDAD